MKTNWNLLIYFALLPLCFISVPEGLRAEAGLKLNILSDVGYSRSIVPQNLPDNWEQQYQPPNENMDTNRNNYGFFWDFGLGAEPIWRFGDKWEIGAPIFYNVTFLGSGKGSFTWKKTCAQTTVDWWDTVVLLEVKLEKTTPAFGMSIRRDKIKMQGIAQRYRIFIEDSKGVDHSGDRNESKVTGRRNIESGWGL